MIEKPLPGRGINPNPVEMNLEDRQMLQSLSIDPNEPIPEGSLESGDDGSITVSFDGAPKEADLRTVPHDANLCQYIDRGLLSSMCSELIQLFDEDKMSRMDWERLMKDGFDYLGIKNEERTFPFKGACGVIDPMIAEAVVRFQSNAIMEIFPEGGPARSKILGKMTPDKQEKANRIEDYFNYLLTEQMPDYRPETEKLLFSLGYMGAAFRKVYADPINMSPNARFVPADQFIVPYGCSTLDKAPRYTEVLKQTANDILKLQAAGFYELDMDLGQPVSDRSDLDTKKSAVSREAIPLREDFYTTLEMHLDYDLPGLEDLGPDGEPTGVALPYIVTIQKDSMQIISVYRNWDEADSQKKKKVWYSAYSYIPGFGFYGLGLMHLVGGIARGSTSILRQLIDAGTLANLRGGFKTRGLRIKGDDSPIAPGEWRDVDVLSGKIEDNIFPLPYGEPSQTLLTLRNQLVDDGRRLASIADVEIGNIGAQAPVGTTLSIMERAMKVMSAVQGRLHTSMHDEFKILMRVVKMITPEQYPYDVEGGSRTIKAADFDGTVDVLPVSNPNAATMSQRLTQYQVCIALAGQFGQVVNIPALVRRVFSVAGIPNPTELVPDKSEVPPADPVTENGNMINGVPARAYDWQDHQAHLGTHLPFLQDPKIMQMIGQNPQGQAIMGALQAHITDHLQYQYRRDIEKQLGVPLPPLNQPMPPQIETQMAPLIAQAANQLLGRNQKEAQMQQNMQRSQDPVIQMQQQELQIKQSQVQQKAAADAAARQNQQQIEAGRQETERLRVIAQSRTDAKRIESDAEMKEQALAASILESQQNLAVQIEKLGLDRAKMQQDNAKLAQDMAQQMDTFILKLQTMIGRQGAAESNGV